MWSLFVTSLVPSDKHDALILLPFILQFIRCTDFFLSDFAVPQEFWIQIFHAHLCNKRKRKHSYRTRGASQRPAHRKTIHSLFRSLHGHRGCLRFPLWCGSWLLLLLCGCLRQGSLCLLLLLLLLCLLILLLLSLGMDWYNCGLFAWHWGLGRTWNIHSYYNVCMKNASSCNDQCWAILFE